MTARIGDAQGRYALALFALADEAGELEQVEADLVALRELLRESEDLRACVRSPLFSRDAQAAALAGIAERAGFCDLLRRFLGLVARKRRLRALSGMIDAFESLMDRRRGRTRVDVRAAQPLDATETAALADALRSAVDGEVVPVVRLDPGLIAGLVVRVGSRMVDNSTRSRLERLRLRLQEAG